MPTLGSLFTGIGGLDFGFERAGWTTAWQVEREAHLRIVLGHRFPAAQSHGDIGGVAAEGLQRVDCIAAGFPCQDISIAGQSRGKRNGLSGHRSGLYWEAHRIIKNLRPEWVVLENVPRLLSVNHGRDFQTIIKSLAELGYLGLWRVLNARYFGVPQNRRRLFVVARLGQLPPLEFMADAGAMDRLPISFTSSPQPWANADARHGYCALGPNTRGGGCRICLGGELLAAEANGWDQMVKRARAIEIHGLRRGLDERNRRLAGAAGNAVVPTIAEWIARHINRAEGAEPC